MYKYEALKPTDPQSFLDAFEAVAGKLPGVGSSAAGPEPDALLYVFDTETTGVSSRDCIVEIGCVEMRNGRMTNRNFIRTCKPYAPMHPAAAKVHGLTEESLADAMTVSEALVDFLHYIEDGVRACASKRIMQDSASAPTLAATGNAAHDAGDGKAEEKTKTEDANCTEATSFSLESLEKKMAALSITSAHKAKWGEKAKDRLSKGLEASQKSSSSLGNTLSSSLNASQASVAPQFCDEEDEVGDGSRAKGEKPTAQNTFCRVAFAGHNVAFDMRMLANCARHVGLDGGDGGELGKAPRSLTGSSGRLLSESSSPFALFPFIPSNYSSLCTMKLFKQLYPGQSSNTLDSCCDFFGIERNLSAAERAAIGDYRLKENVRQHSALTDAYATAMLLERMLEVARQHTGAS